ncbi:hypothetical protein COCNU_06G007770 [Cocos nucifera]|uniref:Uncharacterized protein n=1 Tax=Cocos nucifera TaxID=13894 RepID=A0A8K0IAU2_COCNU|nr:hypothetical protein COCNU_06G007770 [Cocos nucifera]
MHCMTHHNDGRAPASVRCNPLHVSCLMKMGQHQQRLLSPLISLLRISSCLLPPALPQWRGSSTSICPSQLAHLSSSSSRSDAMTGYLYSCPEFCYFCHPLCLLCYC